MRGALAQWAGYLAGLGGAGVLLLALLDSSFLFLPFGIDLLVITLSANSGAKAVYFAAMAAAGSVLGSALIYALARKGGVEGLDRFGKRERIESVKKRIQDKAGWGLALAAIMPPPFPYRVFVAVAGAIDYPKKNLLWVTAVARFGRFLTVGFLGVYFGSQVMQWVESSAFFYSMLALAVISIVGSGLSIYAWWKHA